MSTRRQAVQLELTVTMTVPTLRPAVRADLSAQVMPDWDEVAACASAMVDPDWWFTPADDPAQNLARAVCQPCPVRRSCLAQALTTDELAGIWGGADEAERAWLRLALTEGTPAAAVLGPDVWTAAA